MLSWHYGELVQEQHFSRESRHKSFVSLSVSELEFTEQLTRFPKYLSLYFWADPDSLQKSTFA